MRNQILCAILACCLTVACNRSQTTATLAPGQTEDANSVEPVPLDESVFKFADEVESNRDVDPSLLDLQFKDSAGQTVRLNQFVGSKNVLLVFTRGFNGSLCLYCTTQTSRLIKNYEEFTKRDTEVLLVFPGSRAQLPIFQAASLQEEAKDSFPFPVLLDEDLAAVNHLGIAAQLAFPSTFIIDKAGKIQLSYVGSSVTDRPSVKAILAKLDSLQG
jgi:peroxiredoxin